MPLTKGAAVVAAMTVLLGITSISTPGRAYDLDRPSITTPQVSSIPSVQTLPTQPAAPSDKTDADAARASTDDDAGYASLDEAVAAQDVPEQPDGDLRCLAAAVYYESKGEPLSGQLAVAHVIINRTESGRFPKSVCSVVKQAGQFSFVHAGALPAEPRTSSAYRTAVAVAEVAMNDDWDSSVGDALYFHARRVSPSWRMTRIASIGNHVFYR